MITANCENLIISELIQLSLNYDQFKIDNCFSNLKHNAENTYILTSIKKEDVIISWCFDFKSRSAWLCLDINRKSINKIYHNKQKNINYSFENLIKNENNNDFNKFLKIFKKFYEN